jgi:class 3 adenylate cyclase
MDATESREAVLLAQDSGFFTSAMFAATYPSRTSALVSLGGWPRVLQADDYPWGFPAEAWQPAVEATAKLWGTGEWQHNINPEMPWSEDIRREWARSERTANSPSSFRQASQLIAELDVRDILPTIRIPTLVLHHSEDRLVRPEIGRYMADRIPGAKFVEIPGRNHYLFVEPGWRRAVEEISEFLTGSRLATGDDDRVLATVLFTDIVDSTRRAAELGDRDWRAQLDAHDAVVRSQLSRFRGREVKTTGDGFLATFDGPQRAIKCAVAVRDAVRPLGIEVRAGLHTGECEVRGDDVGGIAVHIGSRVSALAGPGEILVSGTLRDLVVGSGLQFVDRGAHELKGVPGEWKLFVVTG